MSGSACWVSHVLFHHCFLQNISDAATHSDAEIVGREQTLLLLLVFQKAGQPENTNVSTTEAEKNNSCHTFLKKQPDMSRQRIRCHGFTKISQKYHKIGFYMILSYSIHLFRFLSLKIGVDVKP